MNKLLGQHFLKDKAVAKKMVVLASLKEGERVLEIGPGRGALTEKLLEKKIKIIAVEKDPKLVDFLKERFSGEKNLEIVTGDILKLYPQIAADLGEFKIIANIPYYLTGRLLRLLTENRPKPEKTILMIQKEVARRLAARPPKATLLSVLLQFYGEAKVEFLVPAEKFSPPPKVDSAVVQINLSDKFSRELEKTFLMILKTGFRQPRKTLRNNLSTLLKGDKAEAEKRMSDSGLRENQRAQELSLEDWVKLANEF